MATLYVRGTLPMELFEHIVTHALEDTLPIVPFLLITYLALELLEHAAGDRVNGVVKRAGAAGPVVGALLGIVPQCGFSAMGATLYAGRVITLGTLVAVFLSTSDEMLPLLVAERVDAGLLAQVLLAKAAVAAVVGLAVDAALRALRRNARAHAAMRRGVLGPAAVAGDSAVEQDVIDDLAEAGEGADHIHRLCERDHCHCGGDCATCESNPELVYEHHDCDGGCTHDHAHHDHSHDHDHGWANIAKSALIHTAQVTVFIFVITLVLNGVLEVVGEDALAEALGANEAVSVLASAAVGLIPNCAASVVIAQLYLEGVLGAGAMLAGLLVSAGVGLLVLLRANRHLRENLAIIAVLYATGVAWGLIVSALGIVF